MSCAARLDDILQTYDRLKNEVPACLVAVFKPYMDRIEMVLKPGADTHSWTSLVITDCKSKSF